MLVKGTYLYSGWRVEKKGGGGRGWQPVWEKVSSLVTFLIINDNIDNLSAAYPMDESAEQNKQMEHMHN